MVEKFFENREALWLSDEKINEKLKKILGSLPTMATFFEKKVIYNLQAILIGCETLSVEKKSSGKPL
jgi:hypothetical protein